MPLDPQTRYVELGRLLQSVPQFQLPLVTETYQWLGRVSALVGEIGDTVDVAQLNIAIQKLASSFGATEHDIFVVLYRVLAKAELAAPASARGAFVGVGAHFEAFAAIGKVLSEAKSDVLIVDPYLDETALTDFAASAPEGIPLRLLADQQGHKPTLASAARRWATQYGNQRPLEVRLTAPRMLHDRLIILDGAKVFVLTQSLKDFAGRSPASIVRVDADTAGLKVDAYRAIWQSATPLA